MSEFECTIDKELLLYFYRRYEQLDYQMFGISENWYLRKTIQLLTSFSLEAKGQFGNEHTLATYDALISEYFRYIPDLLFKDCIPYYCDEEPTPDYEDGRSIDLDNTYFKQEDLLTYIENNNSLDIDVTRLRRFLIGEEAPKYKRGSRSISELIDIGHKVEDRYVVALQDNKDVRVVNQYSFKRDGKKWSITFFDEVINDIKNDTGMNYIKMLLQNPNKDVGVFDLQAMFDESNIHKSDKNRYRDKLVEYIEDEENIDSQFGKTIIKDELDHEPRRYDELYGKEDCITDNALDATLAKLIKSLSPDKKKVVVIKYTEIGKLKYQLEEADKYNDTINASRLRSLLSILDEDMYDIIKNRSDDPEVRSNSQKVYKNLKDARERIQRAEIEAGYEDTPVYHHLTKHISTGSYCQYNPPLEEHVPWEF